MRILLLGSLFVFLGFAPVLGQTTQWAEFVHPPGINNPYVISGIVKDPVTNAPIPFACVLFREGEKVYCNTTADYGGRFYLEIDRQWVHRKEMEVVFYFKMYKEQSKFYSKKSHPNQSIKMQHQTEEAKNSLRE